VSNEPEDEQGMILLQDVPISRLTLHPKNDDGTYDPFDLKNADDLELLESIEARGIQSPLIINPDYEVLAGSRRIAVAEILGIKTVHCLMRVVPDDDVSVFVISDNKQRRKTPDEIRRELQILAGRMTKQDAAKEVGVSRTTAHRIEKVDEAIEGARESGDDELAEELEAELKTGSVRSAHQKATQAAKPEKPESSFPSFNDNGHREFNQVYGPFLRVLDRRSNAVETAYTVTREMKDFEMEIRNALIRVSVAWKKWVELTPLD
jgi:ParB/RepB/Spo0J family partition protein